MDRVDEAIKDLDVALAKKPNEPRYLEAKCKMLVFSHSWKDAETVCRALLRVEPSNAAGHYNLGLALVELQQREEAMREVERAVSLDPSNKEYRTKLENLRRRQAGNKASAPSATSPSTPKQP
ncbi:MAG: tetratricopeptide repeat protein [Planctomycetota bacterium]|nr:MAG: tetratricopeptide repeat protein [Planctomycetota bacterium]